MTHVFTQDQYLYLQFEVYDAAKGKAPAAAAKHTTGTAADAPEQKFPAETVRVLTRVQLMQGDLRIYESKPLIATEVNVLQRKAVELQLDFPLQSLKPGLYTRQVNIIDDVAGNYAVPRWAMLIKELATAVRSASSVGNRGEQMNFWLALIAFLGRNDLV